LAELLKETQKQQMEQSDCLEFENKEYILRNNPAGKFFGAILDDIKNNEEVRDRILELIIEQGTRVEIVEWGYYHSYITTSKLKQYSKNRIDKYESDRIQEQLGYHPLEYSITEGSFVGWTLKFKNDNLCGRLPPLYHRTIITLEKDKPQNSCTMM